MAAAEYGQRRAKDSEGTEYLMEYDKPDLPNSDTTKSAWIKHDHLIATVSAPKKQNIMDQMGGKHINASKRASLCDMALPDLQILHGAFHQNNIESPESKRCFPREDWKGQQIRSYSVPPLSLPCAGSPGDSGRQHGYAPTSNMSPTRQSGPLSIAKQYCLDQKIKRRRAAGGGETPSTPDVVDLLSPSPRKSAIGQLIDEEKNEPVPEFILSRRVRPNDPHKIKNHASEISQLSRANEENPRRHTHEDAPAPSTQKFNESKRREVVNTTSSYAPDAWYRSYNTPTTPTYKYDLPPPNQIHSSKYLSSRDTAKIVSDPNIVRGRGRNNMPIPGGVKPRNDLAQGIANTSFVGKEKSFNLQQPYQKPSTKQRIEPGCSGPAHREVIKNDSEPIRHRGREVSSQSQRSHTQNGHSAGGNSRSKVGNVEELRQVENTVGVRPHRGTNHRKRKSSQQSSGTWKTSAPYGRTPDATRVQKPTIISGYYRIEDGDDPADPIEDTESHAAKPHPISKSTGFDIRLPSKLKGKQLPLQIKPRESDDELGISGGMISSQVSLIDGSRSRFSNEQGSSIKRRKTNPNDGEASHQPNAERIETLSDDELAGSQVAVGEIKQKDAARGLPTQSSTSKHSKGDGCMYDSESSTDGNRVISDIIPSTFTSNKPPISKKKRYPAHFNALRVLTETRWIWNNPAEPCVLAHNMPTEKSIYISHNDEPLLEISLNNIHKVKFSHDNSVVLIYTSRSDGPKGLDGKYFLELGSQEQSRDLLGSMERNDHSKLIAFEPVKPGYLTDTFKTAAGKLKTKPSFPRASVEKSNEVFDKAIEDKKKPATRKRMIDDLQPAENQRTSRPRLRSSGDPGISPGRFYGIGEQPPQPTPSSGRTINTLRRRDDPLPIREPSPTPEERWTELNLGWQKSWKSSVVWPPTGKNKATVDKDDIARLDEGQFLNDNLVMFYLYHLQHNLQTASPEISKRVYFHNSFFYERLTSSLKGSKKGINYEAVERWTAKVDLLSYDYIIVPVNEHSHWYVAIICNAPRLLLSEPEVTESMRDLEIDGTVPSSPPPSNHTKDSEDRPKEIITLDHDAKMDDHPNTPQTNLDRKPQPSKQGRRKSGLKINPRDPRIIALDSLGITHSPTCTNLKHYLVAEARSKLKIEIPVPTTIGLTVKNLPLQDNYCDCGLFLLGYVEKFLKDPDEFVRYAMTGEFPEDPTYWPDWKGMRTEVRNLLFKLQKQQSADAKKNKKSRKPKSSDECKTAEPTDPKSKLESPEESSEIPNSSRPPVAPQENGTSPNLAERTSPEDPETPNENANHGLPIYRDGDVYPAPGSGGPLLFGQLQHEYPDVPPQNPVNTEIDLPPSVQENTGLLQHERLEDEVANLSDDQGTAPTPTKGGIMRRLLRFGNYSKGENPATKSKETPAAGAEYNDGAIPRSRLATPGPRVTPDREYHHQRATSREKIIESQPRNKSPQSSVAEVEGENHSTTRRASLRKSNQNSPIEIGDDANMTTKSSPTRIVRSAKRADDDKLLFSSPAPYKGPSPLSPQSPVSSASSGILSRHFLSDQGSSSRMRGGKTKSRTTHRSGNMIDASDRAVLGNHTHRQNAAKDHPDLVVVD